LKSYRNSLAADEAYNKEVDAQCKAFGTSVATRIAGYNKRGSGYRVMAV